MIHVVYLCVGVNVLVLVVVSVLRDEHRLPAVTHVAYLCVGVNVPVLVVVSVQY